MDYDLRVIEPGGVRCDYRHLRTKLGGLMSRDFRAGYGPEVYTLRRAAVGTYRIRCGLYAPIPLRLTGPTMIQALVITRYGFPDEARQILATRLGETTEMVDVGAVDIANR